MSEFTTDPSAGRASPDNEASARDKAAAVAQSSQQAASEVASTATDAAKDVVAETKQQAGDLLGKTRTQLTEQAQLQQGAMATTLRDLGDQLAAMTDTNQDGTAIDLARKARDRAHSAADWLEERKPTEVVDELRRVGRERPGQFLLTALLAGIAAGRLTRGAVEVHTDDTGPDATSQHQAPEPSLGRHETEFAAPSTPRLTP